MVCYSAHCEQSLKGLRSLWIMHFTPEGHERSMNIDLNVIDRKAKEKAWTVLMLHGAYGVDYLVFSKNLFADFSIPE